MEELLSLWNISSDQVTPITDGLINHTYKIDVGKKDSSTSFILQRINEQVFPQPEDLMSNYQKIDDHLAVQDFPLHGPKWINSYDGHKLKKFEGGYWRLGVFYNDTQSFSIAQDANMAWVVGKAFGEYDKALLNLPTSGLKDSIIEFHNLQRNLDKLSATIEHASPSRLQIAKHLIESIDNYTYLSKLPFVKNRVIHNDAKVSNLLFRQNDVFAVIDWDTTMAGHISWEYGDLFRTTVITVPEDHPELEAFILQYDMLEGLNAGFKSILFDHISKEEKESLYHGATYLILEQAVRFLEDYLAGDKYYHCDYDDHNYIRARNQFYLLSLMVQDRNTIINAIERS